MFYLTWVPFLQVQRKGMPAAHRRWDSFSCPDLGLPQWEFKLEIQQYEGIVSESRLGQDKQAHDFGK